MDHLVILTHVVHEQINNTIKANSSHYQWNACTFESYIFISSLKFPFKAQINYEIVFNFITFYIMSFIIIVFYFWYFYDSNLLINISSSFSMIYHMKSVVIVPVMLLNFIKVRWLTKNLDTQNQNILIVIIMVTC